MKAMKRTVSVLLSLMLVLGMVTMGVSVASATETNTLTYTSNIGANGSVQTQGVGSKVTVTYQLKTSTTVISAQGVMTFDPAVLAVSSGQTAATVCPNMNSNLMVNLNKTDGRIPFVVSDFANGFDFSTRAVFMTVTFDVIAAGDTAVNLEVSELVGTTSLNTSSDNDVDIVDDGEVKAQDAIETSVEAETESGEPSVIDAYGTFIKGISLLLQDRVGVKFTLNKSNSDKIPAEYRNKTITVKFEGPLESQDGTFNVDELEANTSTSTKHTYYTYSYMMTQPIVLSFYVDGSMVARFQTSVREEAEYGLNKNSIKRICTAMLQYGGAAQVALNQFTDNLASEGLDPVVNITKDDVTVSDRCGVDPGLTAIGLQHDYDNTVLQTAIYIKAYFNVTDATLASTASATIDGKAAAIETSGKQKTIRTEGIFAYQLADERTIVFNNGMTYTSSVYFVIKDGLTYSTNTKTRTALSAMYWYGEAAHDYFNGN